MTNDNILGRRSVRRLLVGGTGGLALILAACGSSAPTATKPAATTAPSAATTAPPTPSGAAPAGVTIGTADVAGVGTVLVNGGDGHTLYLLSSERGGKLTCTDGNGCTKIWPDTELPDGVTSATPGAGISPSLLSTVKSADGKLYPTYGGWPLYEFSHDSAPGQAHGQGIVSFGGTWHVVSAAGTPVTASAPTTPSTTASSSGGGY